MNPEEFQKEISSFLVKLNLPQMEMNSIEQQLKERDKEEKDRYYPFFADCRNDHPIQSKMVDVSRLFSNRRNKSNGFHRKKDLIQTSQTGIENSQTVFKHFSLICSYQNREKWNVLRR